MANRYYTLMLIPEQTTRVKKILIPVHILKLSLGLLGGAVLGALLALYFTLRYFHDAGEFRLAVQKSQQMESEVRQLHNSLASSEQTLLRVRNLEQKLRVILQAGDVPQATGIGPLSRNDETYWNEGAGRAPGPEAQGVGAGFADFQTESANYRVRELQNRSILQEQSLQELYELLQDQKALLAATPSVWPSKGWLTSGFGYRVSPFTGTTQFHEGLDIANNAGIPVLAPADGIVVSAGTHEGYGKILLIDHGYGVVTKYGHLSEVLVKPGAKVKRGDAIASIGNTGRSTGPHLHYEVRVNGLPRNPMNYIIQ